MRKFEKLARKTKDAYVDLSKDRRYKLYNVCWNDDLQVSEITVENDAGFKAIIIGNTNGKSGSRGYMYLFYTNDNSKKFPSIKEIERRLRIVADKEILTEEDAAYFDWEEYGTLEKQREYFSEIILENQ